MIPWRSEEDELLKYWYGSANGAFPTYKHMCKTLNNEFHSSKSVRNYKSVVKREGQVLFGKK